MGSTPQVEEASPRILIVDDDAILAQVLSRYLRRHGMPTQWVADGTAWSTPTPSPTLTRRPNGSTSS